MNTGEKIKSLRNEREVTQATLAEALGVSRQIVGQWERGTTAPRMFNLEMLANFFEVPVEYFLCEKEQNVAEEELAYTEMKEEPLCMEQEEEKEPARSKEESTVLPKREKPTSAPSKMREILRILFLISIIVSGVILTFAFFVLLFVLMALMMNSGKDAVAFAYNYKFIVCMILAGLVLIYFVTALILWVLSKK